MVEGVQIKSGMTLATHQIASIFPYARQMILCGRISVIICIARVIVPGAITREKREYYGYGTVFLILSIIYPRRGQYERGDNFHYR